MSWRGRWRPAKRPRAEAVNGWVALEVRGSYSALIAPESARELAAELLVAADAIDARNPNGRKDCAGRDFDLDTGVKPNVAVETSDPAISDAENRRKGIRAMGGG